MPSDDVERWGFIHEWPEVNGLQLTVLESPTQPSSMALHLFGGIDGVRIIAQIDSTDPGARARAISLGDILHDTLETARMNWEPAEA